MWYEKYVGLPYKHLGNDPTTGIDCFNLCRHVLLREANVVIPLQTIDFCNIVDENWYNKTNEPLFEKGLLKPQPGLYVEQVTTPSKFDVIFMSIGSTNITNHCALYLGNNKMLQIMLDRPSWVSPYGSFYKQYTLGIYRCKNI
jgi:cell wall-associated NlpC family hydrolase